MKHHYQTIRSKRKTLSIEVTSELNVIVRAPLKLSSLTIDDFVNKHNNWISEKIKVIQQRPAPAAQLTNEQISKLKQKANTIIKQKVEHYSSLMGLYPTSVKITSAKKRFGSCSSKSRLCFSYQLMLYPDAAIDYVVVHELAHLKHLNHSGEFYKLIERYLPDYKKRAKLLK